MGLISRLLNRKDEASAEEVKAPAVEVEKSDKEIVADVIKNAKPEVDELPEGKVNRVPVEYTPAPKPNQVFNPDSNEKDPKTPSYL